MKTQGFVKLLRKVIREEVRNVIKEELSPIKENIITNSGNSLQEVMQDPMPRKKFSKKQFTKNTMLNDILNETAANPASQELVDYSSMNYNSQMAQSFGEERQSTKQHIPHVPALATTTTDGRPIDMSNENVAKTVNLMTRDYSALMKAIDKKKNK